MGCLVSITKTSILIFCRAAIQFLSGLPGKTRKRIYHKILETKEDPLRFFIRLSGRSDYRLRVGDHRVIADIDRNKKQIQVTFIGHRKNIYRKTN